MPDMSQMVKVGTEVVDLAQLAGINMHDVEAKRMENFPAGRFRFRLKDGKFGAAGSGEDAKAVCRFSYECIAVHALVDDDEKAEKWLGKSHTNTIFVNEPSDMGRIRAHLEDIGHAGTPGHSFQQNLDAACGIVIDAILVKTPNKNNPDGEPFTNMRKIKPVLDLNAAEAPVATKAA
jgi:hypothetical protein